LAEIKTVNFLALLQWKYKVSEMWHKIRLLQLHHYEGGGAKQRREQLGNPNAGGSTFYYWLKKNNFPKIKLEPVCANCHILIRYDTPTIKKYENNENRKRGK